MDVTSIAKARFDASHTADSCSRHDGHSWKVRAEVKGQLDPRTGQARGSAGLESELTRIVLEIDDGNLDEMMPGANTTPEGVAAWLIERLSPSHPKVTAVEVEMGQYRAARVEREIRA